MVIKGDGAAGRQSLFHGEFLFGEEFSSVENLEGPGAREDFGFLVEPESEINRDTDCFGDFVGGPRLGTPGFRVCNSFVLRNGYREYLMAYEAR